jgi:CheY-like chemotaxis protein
MMGHSGIYGIGALSRMLGVPSTTIRSWEDRYGVVVPERSGGGQRLYSRDQVEHLRFVCEQMETGLSAADAHRVLAERLAIGSALVDETAAAPAHHVLIVERDPYAADLAEYFLRTEGYGVSSARDTAIAQQHLRDHSVDVVVLDLMMGGGEGLRFCERLRDFVHVLAVSALDQRDRALAAGADAFLRKPIEPLTLVSAVRDLIGTSAVVRRSSGVPVA